MSLAFETCYDDIQSSRQVSKQQAKQHYAYIAQIKKAIEQQNTVLPS